MRISDWSSDVCSSDLAKTVRDRVRHARCTSRREDLVAGRDQQDTRTVPYFHLRVVGGSRHDEPCRRQPRSGSKRSEEHTSELQSLMRISYAVFCLKNKTKYEPTNRQHTLKKYKHITHEH